MRTCVPSTSGMSEIAAFPPSPVANIPSALMSPTSSPSSVTLLACSLSASSYMPAVVRYYCTFQGTMLLLLSRFSRVRLCATPETAAHQAPPVPGILQARTLEWVAISFSNAWKWKVKVKSLSCVQPSANPWTAAFQTPLSMGFSRQEYWSGVPLPSPQGTILQYKKCFIFCLLFMYYLCEKYYKPTTVQYFITNHVNWVPRLTLLDLRANLTYECTLGTELVRM